ncbi:MULTISPECIES: hypothetical protein [Agrobacterium]|uniref:Uncharacterized protein n=1 Tax=Agrobacterium larrymoorei TaxID=160699 RepID=A0ABX8TI26_9HYPH|nr:hypothetical protein [Agrobacterium larrymoorei]NSZ10048.1 hypothetical protein [Agrobacterium tumefaciens]QYA10850.1 hypothetical protein J5285_25835 [Agrobacterium larrymoorei]
MRDQNLNRVEFVNGALIGRVQMPDGGVVEIQGEHWPEYGEGAYRLYDATGSGSEIGACWQWSSGREISRRSMMLHKGDMRHYGQLTPMAQDVGSQCYSFEPIGEID